MNDLDELGKMIKSSAKVVFFGGAGVSTESGIPDFRSAAGLYNTNTGSSYSPEYILSHSFFKLQPELFFDFYRKNLLHPEARPNDAHLALAELEKKGKLIGVVTQNIDGLHQMAGSRKVFELHGSVLKNYCIDCETNYPIDSILKSMGIPRCVKCQGIVRPDVVLYEEQLNTETIELAVRVITAADTLIVGGTSLNVYPAAGMLNYFRGNNLVLINKSATSADHMANLVINDAIGKVLKYAVTVALAN